MHNPPRLFFYQHVLSDYNFKLFKIISQNTQFNTKFYFDHDPNQLSAELSGIIKNPIVMKWYSSGRAIEVYLSARFIFDIIRERPSLVLSEDGGNILNNTVLVALKLFFKFKLILWGLGEIPNRKASLYKRMAWPVIRFIWKRCDAIISYSNYGRNVYLREGVSHTSIFVAANAIDLGDVTERISFYNSNSALPSRIHGRLVILFVGRLEPLKFVDDLLLAYKTILISHPNCMLFIVGEGSQRSKLENLSRDLGLDNCYFEGCRDINTVSEYFAFADVCAVPGEGGLVINHSLSHGVPVVVSTCDGTEFDLVTDGSNGVFFERGNNIDLAEKITYVLKNPAIKNYARLHKKNVPSVMDMAMVFNQAIIYSLGTR